MEKGSLNLSFRESEGRLAIWYKLPNGREYLVSPTDFFNAIVGDKYEIWSLVRRKEDILLGTSGISSHLIFEENTCLLIVDDSAQGQTEVQKISINDFWAKAETCLLELYAALNSGVETYYKERVKERELLLIVQQLDMAKVFTSTSIPYYEAVNVEHFGFDTGRVPYGVDSMCERFIGTDVSIGDRTWKAAYNGNEDLDTIRHQLETLAYELDTEFAIEWDWGAGVIEIHIEKFQAGCANVQADGTISDNFLCKVRITSPVVGSGPSMIGICHPRQVVKEIYEAFLSVGRHSYSFVKGSKHNEWHCAPMVFYNKMKSNIIENYINKVKVPYEELAMRQTVVKHVYTICPDYGGVLFHDEENVCSGANKDDTMEFDEENPAATIKVPGIYSWQCEFETQTDGVNGTMGKLDSKAWNWRGLELAQQIRQQLPDEYDLWYAFPFEDEPNRGKRAFLIYKNRNNKKTNRTNNEEI